MTRLNKLSLSEFWNFPPVLFALSKQIEMSYEIVGFCLETQSSWLIQSEMLTKCVVNIRVAALSSFCVNREGKKCNLTGSVRLQGRAEHTDSKEIAAKI